MTIMGKSRRSIAGYIDGEKGSSRKKYYKRLSNKRVRKAKRISSGGYFKKVSDQWDIVDWKLVYEYKVSKKEPKKQMEKTIRREGSCAVRSNER